MTYTPTTWTSTTRISAGALNHLETQYDEVMSTKDVWNNHDSRYTNKLSANTKYFNVDFMGLNSGADADMLDGHHAVDLLGKGLPLGAIVWWSTEELPDGWYPCNGQTYSHSGTDYVMPDYRDKFVVGASTSFTVGNSYGSDTTTPTSVWVTIGGHTLTAAEMPSHRHRIIETHTAQVQGSYEPSFGYFGPYWYNNGGTASKTLDYTGGGVEHMHPSSTIVFNLENNIPPFYALYLIKRMR